MPELSPVQTAGKKRIKKGSTGNKTVTIACYNPPSEIGDADNL